MQEFVVMDNKLYNKELEYIFNRFPSFQKVGGSAYKPGLATMELLSEVLEMPHEKFRAIHIAGTNGKGSTSHMIASALSMLVKPDGKPLKVGLYTSPHLLDFRERMKLSVVDESAREDNGEKTVGIKFVMPEKEFVYDFLTGYKDDFIETGASFFEITTAMAFYWFAKKGVDIAVVECGLGGRLDATNIITPMLSVITNIGLDHCEYLGSTVEEVAGEKAGIIKPGVPVVVGERSGVAHVFESKAAECGSRIVFAEDIEGKREDVEGVDSGSACGVVTDLLQGVDAEDLDLQGACQEKNIKTVKSVLGMLLEEGMLSETGIYVASDYCRMLEKVRYGVCNAARITGLHGRWETLCQKPFVVCDTGHNAHGFAILGEQIKRAAAGVSKYTGKPFSRLVMIFGVVADKDLNSIAGFLPGCKLNSVVNDLLENAPVGNSMNVQYYFVNAAGTRALPADKLQQKMKELGFDGEVIDKGGVDAVDGETKGVECGRKGDIKETLAVYMNELAQEDDFVFIGGSTFVVAEALEFFAD